MVFKKGMIPWNKGKTGIYSTDSLEKMSASQRARPKPTLETRKLMSESHLGVRNHFYGKCHKIESIELMRQSHTGKIMKFSAEALQNKIDCCKNRIWKQESLNKISLSKIGKPRPPHVRESLLKASIGRIATPETRKKLSNATRGKPKPEKWHESMKNNPRKYRNTKPERMMQIALSLNGIEFTKHKVFKIGIRYHEVDIFIEPNICVEVDGVHWHIKEKDVKRDLFQSQELTIMGYHVIRIRDKDILKNTQGCAEKVIQLIKELQHRYLPIG